MIKFIKSLFIKKIPCNCEEVADFTLVKKGDSYQSSKYKCVRCERTYYNPIYGGYTISINPVMKRWFINKALEGLNKVIKSKN